MALKDLTKATTGHIARDGRQRVRNKMKEKVVDVAHGEYVDATTTTASI